MTKLEILPTKRARAFALATFLLAAFALPAGSATAAPSLLTQFCETGSGAGQCSFPAGVATDPTSGDVYVADRINNRINEFTIWGEFIKSFGGGVVNGGATGSGTLTPGSAAVSGVSTTTKEFLVGIPIEATGIAPGTTITAIGNGTLTLSQPATAAATGTPTAISSPEAPGNVPTNERQQINLTATGGSFNLSFTTPRPDLSTQTTTDNLPYNASPAQVQSALESLTNIGAGNVTVTSANPGGEAGVPGGPYTVEFKGRYADTNVRGLQIVAGAAPFSAAADAVEPLRQGAGAPEVCSGLDCREGVDGNRAGQFVHPSAVAVDASGDLYVYETADCTGGEGCVETFRYTGHGANRVQKFDSDGNFLLMFGGDVNEGGGTPSNPGDVCSASDIANGDICGGGNFGSGDGEFGTGPLSTLESSGVAVGPGNKIYVGGEERIQEFAADGSFLKSIAVPGEIVTALAVDPLNGNLYVSRSGKEGVLKLSPAGALLATLAVKSPRRLATDAAGNLYVVDGDKDEIRMFNAAGAEVPSFAFAEGSTNLGGIATSSACGIAGADLFVTNGSSLNSYVRSYGPAPDPGICPPPTVAPTIANQYVTSVGADGATLRAQINPRFWPDTTYYVQYGTGKCSEGGCDKEQPLAPGTSLTTEVTAQTITTAAVFLSGLSPDTTYHYRFVAQSSGGGPVRGTGGVIGSDGAEGTIHTFPQLIEPRQDCPNQEFRTGASAKLADCRAYEMVSPLDKNGGDVAAGPVSRSYGTLAKGSADGNMATFSALRSFANPQASPLINQYLSARGPNGWSTRTITPPRANPPIYGPGYAGQYKSFSEDLCSGWLMQDADFALAPEAPAGVTNTYRRDNCGGDTYQLLSSSAPKKGFGPGELDPEYYLPVPQGNSADGTHTVLRASGELTSNACETPGIFQVYITSPEAPLRLVSILPPNKGNTAVCTQATVGTKTDRTVTDGFAEDSVYHAVSADGSRVFWTDSGSSKTIQEAGFVGAGPGKLYVRVNATEAPSKVDKGKCTEPGKACTQAISASNAQYWGADLNGTKAIYSVGGELFEYDVAQDKSQLIAKGFKGVAGLSDDAARIYLISTEVLSGGQQNSTGDVAQNGKANLYLAEGGAFTFIATLRDEEGEARQVGDRRGPLSSSPGNVRPDLRTSRVSADGLHLAFASAAALSGYDNTDLASGKADAEVYLYDASPGGAGELACVSCNPSGARPRGREVESANSGNTTFWGAALLPGWSEQQHPSRLLSGDSNRLYFNSFDTLVPRDTNGKQDVYEWERATGIEDCEAVGAELFAERAGGCISLISSGQSAEDSHLIDASANGSDVLFATNSSLLPQDIGLVDVYDARTGGGYPAPAAPTPSCEGEACQGPLAPPNDPTPGSSSFEGAGNVKEGTKASKPRCAKGKARRKGRCVAKKQSKRSGKQANHKRRAGR